VLGLYDGVLAFLDIILLRVFVIVVSLNYLFDVCVCSDPFRQYKLPWKGYGKLTSVPVCVRYYVANDIQDSADMAFMICLVHI